MSLLKDIVYEIEEKNLQAMIVLFNNRRIAFVYTSYQVVFINDEEHYSLNVSTDN